MTQLLEYHTEISPSGTAFAEHPIVINGTHDLQVKSFDIALVNGQFTGTQMGYAYFWRDASHYTMMMPMYVGLPMTWSKDFGADYLLVPADSTEQLCLVTQFPGGMPSGIVFDINITYLLT